MDMITIIELVLALFVGVLVIMVLSGGFQAAYPQIINATQNLSLTDSTPLDVYVSAESFHTLECAIRGVMGNYIPRCNATVYNSSASCTTSENGEVSCTVKNFVLPQQVTDAEAFIRDYGDPKFLVYWERFPEEENTWTFLAGDEGWQVALEVGAWTVLGRWTEMSGKGVTSRLTNVLFKSPARTLTGVGVIAASALADAFWGRMRPHNNSLVMFIPGTNVYKADFPEWKGKPVLFKEKAKNFHLVSPCYTLSMKVTKEKVKCGSYNYYWDTMMTVCENPSFGAAITRDCPVTCPTGSGCKIYSGDGKTKAAYRYMEDCGIEAIVISDITRDEDVSGIHNYCYYEPDLATRIFTALHIPVSPQFTAAAALKIAGEMTKAGATPGAASGWFKSLGRSAAGNLLSGIGSALFWCHTFTGNPTCHLDEKFFGFSVVGARWPGVKQ